MLLSGILYGTYEASRPSRCRIGQTFDIAQLTATPTMQPNTTSATLCNPCSMPFITEWEDAPEAMTMAAVIGAWRHIV